MRARLPELLALHPDRLECDLLPRSRYGTMKGTFDPEDIDAVFRDPSLSADVVARKPSFPVRPPGWAPPIPGRAAGPVPRSAGTRQDRFGVPAQPAGWANAMGDKLRSTYIESTRALVAAVEAKDQHTRDHSVNVAEYAQEIGRRIGLDARQLRHLRGAALLHDVGKIGVPDAILNKPGPLTADEFRVIQQHPETALEILGHVSFLDEMRPLILHHHERYDGKGYPAGLTGERIPLGARILAMADALDAMFSRRTYKAPFTLARVREEVARGAGSQFDPSICRVALQWLEQAPGWFIERQQGTAAGT